VPKFEISSDHLEQHVGRNPDGTAFWHGRAKQRFATSGLAGQLPVMAVERAQVA
jgi:hypothetical protein